MSVKKKNKDFESSLNRLEEITTILEDGEATLEESIKLYTEGLEIAKDCNQNLNDAEKKIKIIMEKNKQMIEDDFESDGVE
ncbi:MAG: exodeoxyribonuclease VII small subunit [Candidatus Zixiibacteriota bacterium]|nr:MAG: exodeoxyribonuclease VII small subunit [candidate division Zixibacteria bacterium]